MEREGAKRVPASSWEKKAAEQTKSDAAAVKGKHSACVDCSCPRVRQPNGSLPVGGPSGPRSLISEGRKDCELQLEMGKRKERKQCSCKASTC